MMTAELLPRVKLRLGIEGDERDTLLRDLISDAAGFALAYTGRDELPDGLAFAVCELAVTAFGRLGAEGQKSHAEGGLSVSFDTLPEYISAALSRYRLGRV